LSTYLFGISAISSFVDHIKSKSFNISFYTFIFFKLASVTTNTKSKLIIVALLIIYIHVAKSAIKIWLLSNFIWFKNTFYIS